MLLLFVPPTEAAPMANSDVTSFPTLQSLRSIRRLQQMVRQHLHGWSPLAKPLWCVNMRYPSYKNTLTDIASHQEKVPCQFVSSRPECACSLPLLFLFAFAIFRCSLPSSLNSTTLSSLVLCRCNSSKPSLRLLPSTFEMKNGLRWQIHMKGWSQIGILPVLWTDSLPPLL